MDISIAKTLITPAWGLKDGKLIIGDKEYDPSDVIKIGNIKDPTWMGDGTVILSIKNSNPVTLGFKKAQIKEAHEVIDFLKTRSSDVLAKAEAENVEFHCHCRVCGKLWSFNVADIKYNEALIRAAKSASTGATIGAIFGTTMDVYANANAADKYASQVVNFSKCPNCNSRDVELIEDKDLEKYRNQQNAPTVSPADEIKKFKELLDAGIITQEEFDAKKKQLLNL